MPYYKLVASGRPDVIVDEIILTRDPVSNVVSKSIVTNVPEELNDEEAASLRGVASRIGYQVFELEEDPDEDTLKAARAQAASQSAGADVIGMAPAVSSTGVSGAEVDQAVTQAESENAAQSSSGSTPGQSGGAGNQPPEGR